MTKAVTFEVSYLSLSCDQCDSILLGVFRSRHRTVDTFNTIACCHASHNDDNRLNTGKGEQAPIKCLSTTQSHRESYVDSGAVVFSGMGADK